MTGISYQRITDDEMLGYFEATVVRLECTSLIAPSLAQQRGHADALRLESLEFGPQRLHRAAGVDDVLHEQQMPVFQKAKVTEVDCGELIVRAAARANEFQTHRQAVRAVKTRRDEQNVRPWLQTKRTGFAVGSWRLDPRRTGNHL